MTIEEAVKRWGPHALRYYFISAHYRSALNFTDEALDGAVAAIGRLNDFILTMKQWKEKGPEPTPLGYETRSISAIGDESFNSEFYHVDDLCTRMRRDFQRAMNNDFNVAGALAVLHMYIKNINKRLEEERKAGAGRGCNLKHFSRFDAGMVLETLYSIDKVLGIMDFEVDIDSDIKEMVAQREIMRDAKLWERADALRNQIKSQGYEIDDTPTGTIIKKRKENND